MDHAGERVKIQGHDDPERHPVVSHRQGGLVVLRVRRDGNRVVAEAETGPLEGGPVEIGSSWSVISTRWPERWRRGHSQSRPGMAASLPH